MSSNFERLPIKRNYAVSKKWEPFYTGGRICQSEDGAFLFCLCFGAVKIVAVDSGAVVATISTDGDDVACFSTSRDDRTVVTATASLLLKQWEWRDGVKCVRTWNAIHTSAIKSMAFDRTSTLVATGGSDATIKVWDLLRQYCTHNLKGSSGVVSAVVFHPNSLFLFSASSDYNVRLWDLEQSRCVRVLESHVSAVTSLTVRDKTLVSSGRDSVVCLWTLPKNLHNSPNKPSKVIPVFESVEDILVFDEEKLPSCVTKSDGGFHFMTVGSKGVLRIWDSLSCKCVYGNSQDTDAVKGEANTYYRAMHLKGNNCAAVVTADHNIDIISLDSLKLQKNLVGYNDEVIDIKVAGEGNELMVVVTNSPHIKVFGINTAACQLVKGHTDIVIAVDVFKNKTHFVSSSKDRTVRLWKISENLREISCLSVGHGHTKSVSSLAACQLKMNFVVSGSEDSTMKIWQVSKHDKTLKVLHTELGHSKDVTAVCVAPNDKLIATGSQDKLAKLWDPNGVNLGTFRGHKRGISSLQFSPMDQVLGSSSADGTVRLWSISDFTNVKTFEGHDCSVLNMIFVAKGMQFLSAGTDGLLKLWTIKDSECVKTLDAHNDKIWALCSASENDDLIVTGSSDSKILMWKDVTGTEMEEEFAKMEEAQLNYQKLQNLMHEKKYKKALMMAIRLEQPFTTLKVIKEIVCLEKGDEIVEQVVGSLTLPQKQTVLNFITMWNTNSKNCHAAQIILKMILSLTAPNDLKSFDNIKTLVESILPYSARHFQRMSKISQQATFLDYTWQIMKLDVKMNEL